MVIIRWLDCSGNSWISKQYGGWTKAQWTEENSTCSKLLDECKNPSTVGRKCRFIVRVLFNELEVNRRWILGYQPLDHFDQKETVLVASACRHRLRSIWWSCWVGDIPWWLCAFVSYHGDISRITYKVTVSFYRLVWVILVSGLRIS